MVKNKAPAPDAKPRKGHKWEKGKSPNPSGRPKQTEAMRDAKRIMLDRYPEFVIEMFTSPYEVQVEKLKAKEGTAAEMLFRACFLTATKKGDIDTFMKIMNRIIGPSPLLPLTLEGLDGIIANIAGAVSAAGGGDDADRPRIIINIPHNGR